jgi:hypothetical protein
MQALGLALPLLSAADRELWPTLPPAAAPPAPPPLCIFP